MQKALHFLERPASGGFAVGVAKFGRELGGLEVHVAGEGQVVGRPAHVAEGHEVGRLAVLRADGPVDLEGLMEEADGLVFPPEALGDGCHDAQVGGFGFAVGGHAVEGDGLFVAREGFVELGEVFEDDAQIAQVGHLGGGGAHFGVELPRLLVAVAGLVEVTELAVDVGHVGQLVGSADVVLERLVESEGLLVVLERSLGLAEFFADDAQGVPVGGEARAVACLLVDLGGLFELGDRFAELACGLMGGGQVGILLGGAGQVVLLLAELEGLAVALDGFVVLVEVLEHAAEVGQAHGHADGGVAELAAVLDEAGVFVGQVTQQMEAVLGLVGSGEVGDELLLVGRLAQVVGVCAQGVDVAGVFFHLGQEAGGGALVEGLHFAWGGGHGGDDGVGEGFVEDAGVQPFAGALGEQDVSHAVGADHVAELAVAHVGEGAQEPDAHAGGHPCHAGGESLLRLVQAVRQRAAQPQRVGLEDGHFAGGVGGVGGDLGRQIDGERMPLTRAPRGLGQLMAVGLVGEVELEYLGRFVGRERGQGRQHRHSGRGGELGRRRALGDHQLDAAGQAAGEELDGEGIGVVHRAEVQQRHQPGIRLQRLGRDRQGAVEPLARRRALLAQEAGQELVALHKQMGARRHFTVRRAAAVQPGKRGDDRVVAQIRVREHAQLLGQDEVVLQGIRLASHPTQQMRLAAAARPRDDEHFATRALHKLPELGELQLPADKRESCHQAARPCCAVRSVPSAEYAVSDYTRRPGPLQPLGATRAPARHRRVSFRHSVQARLSRRGRPQAKGQRRAGNHAREARGIPVRSPACGPPSKAKPHLPATVQEWYNGGRKSIARGPHRTGHISL